MCTQKVLFCRSVIKVYICFPYRSGSRKYNENRQEKNMENDKNLFNYSVNCESLTKKLTYNIKSKISA